METVYHGYARPCRGPVLSSMWAFNHDLPILPYDPEEARRLLAEAGWRAGGQDGLLTKNGQTFALNLPTI